MKICVFLLSGSAWSLWIEIAADLESTFRAAGQALHGACGLKLIDMHMSEQPYTVRLHM